MQPNNAVILNNLAWAAGQIKDPKAVEYAEKALSLQPNSAAIMDTLGMLLTERGNAERGVELLQKAVAAAPEAHAIRLNLAKALVAAGRKDQAKLELEPLIKLGDKFPGKEEAAALMKTL
jgi:predicted Zn-dependent protease